MKAYLVSVGCDQYSNESLNNLSGAENDASSIYGVLVNSEYSMYDEKSSFLLRSPKVDDVRNCLEAALFENVCPDVFTLFFAGHGGVSNGTYYLCLNETRTDRISFTGLSLSEVFRLISSSEVRHVNLVIDACNTAGLVNDLLSLVKPDLMGAKGSFGISILAAAASDEFASEVGGQGILTGNLLSYISGSEKVNSELEYLDLVSLGRVISSKFIQEKIEQTPSSWGMNLYGPSIFSKNPYFSRQSTISTHDVSFIPSASRVGSLLLLQKDKLWNLYENLDEPESINRLLDILRKTSQDVESIEDLVTLIKGVGYRFIRKYEPTNNFKQLEIINAITTLLIPHLSNTKARDTIREFMHLFKQYCVQLIDDLMENLNKDRYFLLNREGSGFDSFSNHYYLPIRISKILGYSSQLLLIDKSLINKVSPLLDFLLKEYVNHLKTLSDIQAPFLYSFFSVYSSLQEKARIKDYLVAYMTDYIKCSGRVTTVNIQPENAAKYIIERYSGREISQEYTAKPNSLGASLLLQSQAYGLSEELDPYLHLMDRHNFYFFIPNDINQFGEDYIESGYNLVVRCGFQFWSCGEFCDIIKENFLKYTDSENTKLNEVDSFSCVASSFVQPNRIPLMLYPIGTTE